MFEQLFNAVEDAGIQMVANLISQKYLAKIGTITKTDLVQEKEEISFTLELKGETSPIHLTIKYDVTDSGAFVIKNVVSSREWIAVLINEMIPDHFKSLQTPPEFAPALSKLKTHKA